MLSYVVTRELPGHAARARAAFQRPDQRLRTSRGNGLGIHAEVPTIDGKAKIKIPPGTQSGKIFRLKGKGFPVYKQEGQSGDLYVTLEVKLPTNLTEKEKELFGQLAALKK